MSNYRNKNKIILDLCGGTGSWNEPYIQRQFISEDYQKESEWVKLVGIDFYTLSEARRRFLIQTAGAIKFKNKVNFR